MSLIILEGLDRVGKTTAATYFASLGYEITHMSAPAKYHTADSFLQEMADLISSASFKDIVLDRSHYGELIWPNIFERKSLLSEDDIEVLREIENSVGTQRIFMMDNNVEAHWKRCVDNKEPINKAQFVRARGLYSSMANRYGFETMTLQAFVKQFPDAQKIIDQNAGSLVTTIAASNINQDDSTTVELSSSNPSVIINTSTSLKIPAKTPEQHKLEVANAINDILSRRILKSKGDIYDNIENEMRTFLNTKLGKLLGGNTEEVYLTPDEIKFYKTMYIRATKQNNQ